MTSTELSGMGAIAGMACIFNGREAEIHTRAMAGVLSHRAPNGWDILKFDNLCFAQGFHSTDSSHQSDLKIARESTQEIVVAADATIYNRSQLFRKLRPFIDIDAEASDNEIILAAWKAWGRECLQHLIGDFSFSIWDRRSMELLCIRDHFGGRPLYYAYNQREGFAFSSELKALTRLPWIKRKLDEEFIADYLLDIECDHERTVYAEIRRIPPSTILRFAQGSITFDKYWTPDSKTELRLGSDQEYEEAFRDKFNIAVQRRLSNADSTGILLSGGLDSSSVAAVAARIQKQKQSYRPASYSYVYENSPSGDERKWSREVAEYSGLQSNYIASNVDELFSRCGDLFDIYGQPYRNPMSTMGLSVWEEIASSGIRITLDGVDGDSVISYNSRYLTELAKSFQFWSLFRESVSLSHWMFEDKVSPFSIMWLRGIRPCLYSRERMGKNLKSLSASWLGRRFNILDPSLALRANVVERLTEVLGMESALTTHRGFHCYEVTHRVMSSSLENINLVAAKYGIEARHPYFDRELVEFCISLPRQQKIRNGWTRSIVRRALASHLPESVVWRGCKWSPDKWIQKELRIKHGAWLSQLFRENLIGLAGMVNLPEAHRCLERFLDNESYDDGMLCISLAVLILWLRKL